MIIMDVLPYYSKEIFSFIYPRSTGKKPAEDYCILSDILGNTWWAEKKRTNKNYLATRLLLENAKRNDPAFCAVIPPEIKIPAVKKASLIHLKLGKSDLNSPELEKIIKSAAITNDIKKENLRIFFDISKAFSNSDLPSSCPIRTATAIAIAIRTVKVKLSMLAIILCAAIIPVPI